MRKVIIAMVLVATVVAAPAQAIEDIFLPQECVLAAARGWTNHAHNMSCLFALQSSLTDDYD